MTPREIPEENLKLWLEIVSERIGYRFEDWDWDAIRFGLRDTNIEQEAWYEYELNGDPPINFAFACAMDAGRVLLRWKTEATTAARIEAITTVLQSYVCGQDIRGLENLHEFENLVESAFADTPYPGDNNLMGCNASHLAICLECQEAQRTFRGKHWKTLLHSEDNLPHGVAGMNFLSPAARLFFFPAYLVAALQNRNAELFDYASDAVVVQSENFTILQIEIVSFVSRMVQTEDTYR